MKNFEERKGHFYPIECDIGNEQKVIQVFRIIKNTYGGVHILINNAGAMRIGAFTGNYILRGQKLRFTFSCLLFYTTGARLI